MSAEVDKAVVYSLKNIERAFLDTDKPDKWVMRTEGINFEEVFREPAVFELDRVYTNNIHEMMTRYGVEAARACISKVSWARRKLPPLPALLPCVALRSAGGA